MIPAAREELNALGLTQHSALIRLFLHETPAEDPEAFSWQAARALWLEERLVTGIGKEVGREVGKIMARALKG